MDTNDEAFLKRLLATFKEEAEEHLRALSDGLVELEQSADAARRRELVETVFRETHSFKGAARAVGKGEIEALCQGGESVFAALKEESLALSAEVLDLLHEMADLLELLLLEVERDAAPAQRSAAAELGRRLRALAVSAHDRAEARPSAPAAADVGAGALPPRGETKAAEPPGAAPTRATPATDAPPSAGTRAPSVAVASRVGLGEDATVRIPAGRVDAVLFQAEALLGAKLAAGQRVLDLRGVRSLFTQRQRECGRLQGDLRALRREAKRDPSAAPAPRLRRVLDHLASEETFLKGLGARLGALERVAEQGARTLGGQVDGLLDDVKRILMLPVATAFDGLPKLVRDLARAQGKEVDFRASGGEVEIDRRILESLRDPLIHLLRNAVDHGIEVPAARRAAGKPPRGSLELSVVQIEGNRIEIRVVDDGVGIDRGSLRKAVRRRGLATEGEDDAGLLPLVFESGVSTAPLITDISGRGLGLAIVREKVERLGGAAVVESEPGRGATFCLVVPLTLATFRGVRVRVAGEELIFPTILLDRVVRVRREDIVNIEGRPTIRVGSHALALVRLHEVLELGDGEASLPEVSTAVIAGSGERRIAFQVDEVIGEQEVLVKGLGRQLRRVRNIAGATVLGSGKVVPILYVPDLLKSARHVRAPGPAAQLARPAPKSILVAEDSITSRMLLKGILESAGYRVTTAVDGADAYDRLRAENFDLLVSDVDMPRMGGLALTAQVRADRQLRQLPVVLVTALGSREDRERGAEVGANAYLVKSSFDQSDLLSVIRRLL